MGRWVLGYLIRVMESRLRYLLREQAELPNRIAAQQDKLSEARRVLRGGR
jgi:hypothetical protein